MEEGKTESNNKGLVILLCVLLVMIVGLVVGIVIATIHGNEQVPVDENNNFYDGDAALLINESIEEKLSDDPNYFFDDAVAEYEYEMSFGDTTKRIYVAINYANFIYNAYEDINKAIGIMRRIEPLINSTELYIDYYVAMRNFYRKDGDLTQVEYYNQKIEDLIPVSEPLTSEEPKEVLYGE